MEKEQRLSYRGHILEVFEKRDETFFGHVFHSQVDQVHEAESKELLVKKLKHSIDLIHDCCIAEQAEDEKRTSSFLVVVFVLGALISLLALFYFPSLFPKGQITSDHVSGVSSNWLELYAVFFNGFTAPALTFLSLTGLLYTLYWQIKNHKLSLRQLSLTRQELEFTRKELEYTRGELRDTSQSNEQQAIALKKQVETTKKMAKDQLNSTKQQQFDSMFYTLLNEHNRLLDLVVDAQYLSEQKRWAKTKNKSGSKQPSDDELSKISSKSPFSFADTILQQQPDLCRYYRFLYQLLKFIAREHPNNLHKRFDQKYITENVEPNEKAYASIVRSAISDEVLLGLAVNCSKGWNNCSDFHSYYLLLSRYSFLEHFRFEGGINIQHLQFALLGIYPLKVWGNNEHLLESGFVGMHAKAKAEQLLTAQPKERNQFFAKDYYKSIEDSYLNKMISEIEQ